MQFESFSEFLNMGGYAFYVWLSYGVTFGSLGTLLFLSLRQKRSVLLEISKKMEREDRLKETRSSR
ncbi:MULTISPECIES: heme exporter protein CcmD [unclassified Shewanella]|uniref:heme exporter protein CcmD n=1 Tax=unclassified Shewanella TaxID=196818 RepID=UPI000C8478AA|nr:MULTISPECIES: heme exporter protein CcmD [unclassified Shewanella]MDO6621156.1 heme exporter protein CcmD [Shewanella sp. 6_MG-2023]MDO6642025.1 heme exporter protein CcmD [Shewanella sp. 5_MG-2023]MDO6680583.1 heme exporter protein CcmD [Shewanella sp. 4_MG-2023]MDO6777561.1 heme exporter protein CcmD [Shewanella sp. 3_MG-2023]PMG27468.1 heme exporter protein CcmD [Shewanella sp. 10N.286.52.C2]